MPDRPSKSPAIGTTCSWVFCDDAATDWYWSAATGQDGRWIPVCREHTAEKMALDAELDATTGPIELPSETSRRTAAFHLAEAEQHLLRADEHVAAGRESDAIARLLAANANAQIGALKLAQQQDAVLQRVAGYLADLSRDTPQQ